jgi:hypothetical protein
MYACYVEDRTLCILGVLPLTVCVLSRFFVRNFLWF